MQVLRKILKDDAVEPRIDHKDFGETTPLAYHQHCESKGHSQSLGIGNLIQDEGRVGDITAHVVG